MPQIASGDETRTHSILLVGIALKGSLAPDTAAADPEPAKKKNLSKRATKQASQPKADPKASGTSHPDDKSPSDAAAAPAADATQPTASAAGSKAGDADKPPADPADPKAQATQQPAAPTAWSETEIAEGRARCAAILQRIHAIATPAQPMRQGPCGTPAPIELISIGSNPPVSLSPPPIVTCELAENLANWLEQDLQPLAKKHLGSEIIKIETMSSYSCRNAYGRVDNKLSEHGLANALDVGGFVTSSARTAMVLADWGTPQREIAARIAAEKAKAAKLAAEKAAADKAAQTAQMADKSRPASNAPPAATADSLGAPAAGIAKSTVSDGTTKLTVTLPGAQPDSASPASSLSFSEPSRLGATDLAAAQTARAIIDIGVAIPSAKAPPAPGRATAFLHEAHAAACRIFNTTLGPEANAAHRNHFHVDMAQRRPATTKICD